MATTAQVRGRIFRRQSGSQRPASFSVPVSFTEHIVPTKTVPSEGKPAGNADAHPVPGAASSLEHILRISPDVFRAVLQRISPETEPARWAAEQLKLGAVLRLRAQRECGSTRTLTCRQSIDAFEAALCIYCGCQHVPETPHGCGEVSSPTPNFRERETDVDPVDLVLDASRRPFLFDIDELDEAIRLLRASCTRDVRRTDFKTWVRNMINLGCTLALVGKSAGPEGHANQLEEAIDMFRAVLSERRLLEIPYERAVLHINMADALGSMGERVFPDQRQEYLESAMTSLATALSLVAPPMLRCVVQADPVGFM